MRPTIITKGATLTTLPGTEDASHPFWSPDSRQVGFSWRPETEVMTAGALKRVSLDGGAPVTVTTPRFTSHAAWNQDGTILFTRSGTRLGGLGEQGDWGDVALSPDETRAASARVDPALGTRDIWVFDVKQGIAERFTSDPFDEFAPVWAPDSSRLIFSAQREGRVDLYQKAHATAPAQRLPRRRAPAGKVRRRLVA